MSGAARIAMDLTGTPWRRINLQDDHWCLVDADDYDWLLQWRWNCGSHYRAPSKWYAKRNVGSERSTIYLHRVLLARFDPRPFDFMAAHHGDHVNGQSLDDRRENLRWATPADNRAWRRPRDQVPSLEAIVAELVAGLAPADRALERIPF